MRFLKKVSLFLVCVVTFLSCEKEGRTVYVNTDEEETASDMVFFVSKKGSLGDIGYVDALYRSVVKGANGCGLPVSLVELPADTARTLSTLEYMLNYMQTEKSDCKALVVIANDNLEAFLHRNKAILTQASNVDFLLCESADTTLPIYTVKIPQYGAYYQAGRVVAEGLEAVDSVLIVSANPNESGITEMREGFCQAIKDCGAGIYVENTYLSETSGGYDQANCVYRQSYDIDRHFDMVIPLCGGTAQGFYRYNRENPASSFYTVGVDTDMQLYSTRVPFSVVKNLDTVMKEWIFNWWNDEIEIPGHAEFDLASKGSRIVISDSWKKELDGIPEKYYNIAVEKEKEYENQ